AFLTRLREVGDAEPKEAVAEIKNTLKDATNKPLMMVSDSQPEFYSAVARTIENQRQDKFSADQIKALLNPQKTQGIKQEEIDWLGIN
ncbi:hypothetical protein INO17_14470, partial [Staphylococcus aureus]|nr:hypothetical protein [Staphylococcus aureus]